MGHGDGFVAGSSVGWFRARELALHLGRVIFNVVALAFQKKINVGSALPQAEAECPPRARGHMVGRGALQFGVLLVLRHFEC